MGQKVEFFNVSVLSFYDHIFISIGKPTAIGRTLFIDTAIIIAAQKRTWFCFDNKITIFINFQDTFQ